LPADEAWRGPRPCCRNGRWSASWSRMDPPAPACVVGDQVHLGMTNPPARGGGARGRRCLRFAAGSPAFNSSRFRCRPGPPRRRRCVLVDPLPQAGKAFEPPDPGRRILDAPGGPARSPRTAHWRTVRECRQMILVCGGPRRQRPPSWSCSPARTLRLPLPPPRPRPLSRRLPPDRAAGAGTARLAASPARTGGSISTPITGVYVRFLWARRPPGRSLGMERGNPREALQARKPTSA